MKKHNWEKIKNVVLVGVVVSMVLPFQCQASQLADSKLITGTTKLLNDAMNVVIALDVTVSTAMCGINLLKLQSCAEEEKAKYKKNIKTIAMTAIGIVIVPALINIVLAYYN